MRKHQYFPHAARITYVAILVCAVLLPAALADETASPPPVPPQDQNKKALASEIEKLVGKGDEILVTAPTLKGQPVRETIPAINVVTREAIHERVPLGMTEALRDEPGLWTTQGGSSTIGTPVLRGFQGNQVLLLLDGIRLTHDRTNAGPGPDWELVDLDMIDRIEVLRSPDSVLYGTGAVGGVTAVYTGWPIDFAEEGWAHGGHARVSVSAGGIDLWRARVEGRTATPEFRGVLGATMMHSGDLKAAGPQGMLHPTEFEDYGFDLRTQWKTGPNDTIGFSFFGMRKKWFGDYLHPDRERHSWLRRGVWIATWAHDEPCGLWDSLDVRFGVVNNARLYRRTDRLDDDRLSIWTVQATVTARKQVLDHHELLYGLDSHMDRDDESRTNSAGTLRGVPKGYIVYVGAFVQDEWDVTDKLSVVGGARVDGVWAKTSPEAATTDPLIDPEEIRIDTSDQAWTGKIGVRHQTTERLWLTGNVSRGYRHPALLDLASFVQAPDEVILGTPTVKPEYSLTYELGVHYAAPTVRGSLAAFRSSLTDAIIRTFGELNGMSWIDRDGDGIQDDDEDIYVTSNAGSARFWGLELAAEVDVREEWTVFGNLTLWDGTITPDPTEPIGIPNNATLGIRYHPTQKFFVQFAGHMVARFDKIPAGFYAAEDFFKRDPQDDASATLRGDHSVPGYALFDIRIGAQLSDGTSVTFGVDNLFDRHYRSFGARHDGPGLTVSLSVSRDF